MKEACLHLPLDFEMRTDVRKLARLCSKESTAGLERLAALFVVRLWADWGREGVDWRPLDGFTVNDERGGIDWERESITFLIEDYCGWPPESGRGALMQLFVEAGMIGIEQRGSLKGLVLRDFWRYNEHLSPDYRSIQSLGGMRKAERRREKQMEEMAGQQVRLLQGSLVFPESVQPTPAELTQATGLVMRLDRAGGAALRGSSEYSTALMECAIEVVRRHGKEAITAVERYLHGNRDNPEVVKAAERVVEKFDDYLAKARASATT